MGEHSDVSTFGRIWSNIQSFITEHSDFTPTSSYREIDVEGAVKKLEDDIYEVHQPETGKPVVDIVFFHGLYLGATKDAHVTTWLSSSSPPEFWIKTWLVEKFPQARILTVSYDASTRRGDEEGRSDLFLIAESLFYALVVRHEVGQHAARPVILVGHSFGALLIKSLCEFAHRPFTDSSPDKAKKFVSNVRGFFLFAPPSLGMNLNEKVLHSKNLKLSPLVKYLKHFKSSTTRLNESFGAYCKQHNWIVDGVGESHLPRRANLGDSQMELFGAGVIVPEASARSYMHRFHQVEADHFSICRPKDRSSSAFKALVDSIERMLSNKVPESFLQISLPQHVIGLTVHIDNILHIMEEANSVGIFGMGGVGKSTLAKAVLNRIGPEFECCCFVEVKLEAKRGKLQKRIIKSLRDSYAGHGQDPESSSLNWEDFEGRKVLIMLDDIDDSGQLSKDVLPSMTYFGQGSVLVATSRDAQLLKNFARYELTVLDLETSRQLFCSHAFQDQPVPAHLEHYVDDVVRKCDGLPLAIEVIGSYLNQKEKEDMWKDVLDRLARAEEPSGTASDSHDGRRMLWSTLKISYDALESSERQLFLDLATIFYGEPLHIIKASWSTSWGSAESGLQNLISKCLVRLVEIDPLPRKRRPFHPYRAAFDAADTKLTVWIHEQLRDLGQSLVTRPPPLRDSVPVEKWSRVWRQEDAEKLLRGSYRGKPPETIGLAVKGLTCTADDLSKSLEDLKQLKFLLFEPPVKEVKLPLELSLLRTNMLCGYPSGNLKHLIKLAVLELYACNQPGVLFHCIGKLTNLRVLTIRRCCTFMFTSDPSTRIFPPHEEFSICPGEKTELLQLPEEIGQLSSLRYLILDVKGFSKLPDSFGDLSRLTYCFLSCENLVSLPENFGRLTSLTELILKGCTRLTALPETFGNLPRLERLIVTRCHSLTEMPESVGNLSTLKTLSCSWSFQSFPESFGNLSGLQSLFCDVEALPGSFGKLAALEELICPKLNVLNESFGPLHSLKHMTIENSDNIQDLPESFGLLSKLEKLSFYDCHNLRTLPESFGNLQFLKSLRFHQCRRLNILPESFGELAALEKLHFYACPEVNVLPQSFGGLVSLRELYFRDCSFTTLPSNFGQLAALEKLQFARCQQLELSSDGFGPLNSLRRLDIIYCQIPDIPFTREDLSRVEKLKIRDCYRLKTPLESFGQLQSLKRLDIYSCSITVGSFEGLDKLEQLKIDSCSKLTKLPDSFEQLRSLKHLEITDCPIEFLPESSGDLATLGTLLITRCRKLTSLPEAMGKLTSLKRLRLDQCPIAALPESFGELSSLKELVIVSCSNLVTLPSSFGGLHSLKHFTFGGSPTNALPDVFRELRELEELHLIECRNLKSLPESLRRLSFTQPFKIHTYHCPVENVGRDLVQVDCLSPQYSGSFSQMWSWIDAD